jgi:hypothetical protein
MRACAIQIALAVALTGCSGKSGDNEEVVEPDPKGWTIEVDMSATDRFVQPETSSTWRIHGMATATDGIASIDVAGAAAERGDDGVFTAETPAALGLTRVNVLVTDEAGHTRKGDRTLLAARLLPEGAHNPVAASLILDDAILASMGEGLAAEAGTVDVAAEIMARDILSQDDRCVTWPVQASQGEVAVDLVEDRGNLWLRIRIPNLYVYFEGSCQGLLSTIPIGGEMGGTIDVWTRLTANSNAPGQCLSSFAHTSPEVEINNWGFDVWGLGGPLQNWIVSAFSGEKSGEARSQIASEVGARADSLLTEKLADIQVFDRTSEMDLLDAPIALHLCLGGLEKIDGKLIARVAANATGGGDKAAPGIPQIDGALIAPGANELVLDANLVGQLLFSSWKAGGLSRPGPDADISILQVLVPELYDNYSTAMAQITIDGELPPLVSATPDGPGDLKVQIGDMMVDLTLEDDRVFRFGVILTLSLELTPEGGKLVPSVVDSQAQVWLLDERYDGPDEALETAIAAKVAGVAGELIGADAAIALPDLPGLGAPTTVSVDPGGRFLRIGLE